MKRFVNADTVSVIDGGNYHIHENNLFTYCFNNPITYSDNTGTWPTWATKLVAAVAVITVVAVVAAVTVATAGAGSAAACMAVGAAQGAVIGSATGAVTGAVTAAVSHVVTTGGVEGMGQAALEGAAQGALTGAVTGAITGAISPSACFVAGTGILTSSGYAVIEGVKAGDEVWSWNEETNTAELKRVVEAYVTQTDELVYLGVNGEKIITTPTHPFYVPEQGWTAAIDLRAGDVLQTVNGKRVIVEFVQHEILESPLTVYNFQVEDNHTYYVAAITVLVHNSCSKNAAMREAKRIVNIPMNQSPDAIEKVKMLGANGRTVFAKLEIYGDRYIRDDLGGHLFKDGTSIARHYNAGIIKDRAFISNGKHFFY